MCQHLAQESAGQIHSLLLSGLDCELHSPFGLGTAAGSTHCFVHRIDVFTLKYLECYLKSSSNSAAFALTSGLGFKTKESKAPEPILYLQVALFEANRTSRYSSKSTSFAVVSKGAKYR